MNLEKHQNQLNTDKFDRITFAIEYIQRIRDIQGDISTEDFAACLSRLYDQAFWDGQQDLADRTITALFKEIDIIEQNRKA